MFALLAQDGIWHLGEVDRETGAFNRLRHDCDFFEQITAIGDRIAVVAANPARAKHIRRLDFEGAGEVLRSADSLPADAALSRP